MIDYRIYLHGRPQGQDIWCANIENDNIDKYYLQPYLDARPGNNAASALIVDVWKNRTYYTFIHCKNVIEKTSRPNAYAAITLRLNGSSCHKVSVIFKLLDQIFQKFIIGNFLESSNGNECFMVSQFQEKESVAKQISDLIAKNFDALIAPSCETLNQSNDTKDVSPKFYNYKDVDSPTFFLDAEKSRVIISTEYISKDKSVEEIHKKIEPLNHRISELEASLRQSQSNVAVLESEKSSLSSEVISLRSDVKDLGSKLSNIEAETKKKYEKEIETKDKQLLQSKASFDQERKRLESEIKGLNHKCEELEKQKKDPSINITSSEELLRHMAERFQISSKKDTEDFENSSKRNDLFSKISPWMSFVNFIILVGILAFLLCISSNSSVSGNTNSGSNQITQSDTSAETSKVLGNDSDADVNVDKNCVQMDTTTINKK